MQNFNKQLRRKSQKVGKNLTMPQLRWNPDGDRAAVLFDLFNWNVPPYDIDNFDHGVIYNEPNHQHIWRPWKLRSFKQNLDKVVKKVRSVQTLGTGAFVTMILASH